MVIPILFLASVAAAQAPAVTPQSNQPPAQTIDQLPWPVKLGARSHVVSQGIPLVDRVVLVPDVATYVDELGKWSRQGRWPVLIEDGIFAPMFVRRFKPSQLIRRESVGSEKWPVENAQRQQALEAVVIRAFGGNPDEHTVREVFALEQYSPPGVVVTSVTDPAWTAAVALAAGHAQPLVWLDESFGQPSDELNDATAQRLVSAMDGLVAGQHYTFRALGDEIDAITICKSIGCKSRAKLPNGLPANADGPVSTTDMLGRNPDGTRYAITGWIFGDEIRSAYVAMCSLFLPRDRITMWNTYPETGGWLGYAMNDAAALFQQGGFTVQHIFGRDADEHGWLRALTSGFTTDMVMINSKGNNNFFDLSTGTAYPPDVPVLNEPVALHLIHSWSLQHPDRADTVGGQWLMHGAYAMVGSCWEPMLGAFVPPKELSNRWVNFVPFLVGARWWDNQGTYAIPWRVVTIGDPLMLCAPPEQCRKQRLAQPSNDGVDLGEHVKDLLRQAEADESGTAFAQAMVILDMLGKDEVAVGVWRLASSKGKGEKAARAALGPLFRRREVEEFLNAWSQTSTHDSFAADMLWHLCTPRLGPGNTTFQKEMLIQLQSAIRQPLPQHDMERLAPALARTFGKAKVQEVIQREMKKARTSSVTSALTELLKKY